MTSYCGWPYATKAIFQHERINNILYIYVIFKHPMDTDVKPPRAKWIIKVDAVQKNALADVWIDEWTLKLTVLGILTQPTTVHIEYDGPDADLHTTWGKQWEPFGPIPSEDKTLIVEIVTGMILLWSGSIGTIPTGWHLCDGTAGTPDLRDRFIVGAGNDYLVNGTGGTIGQVHTFDGDGHAHQLNDGSDVQEGDGYDTYVESVQVTGTTDVADNRPPYYALAYIMKI